MAVQRERKYYIKGHILPFEEDNRTEFKGHLNLCKEEVPLWAQARKAEKASRRPASRNFNAFLNSGIGGTIYLGVVDNGKIMGFKMSYAQRDHFLKAVEDLVSRYTPPVLPQQYSVTFVPVFNGCLSQEEITARLDKIDREEMPESHLEKKHHLRQTEYCWCDKEFVATYSLSHSEGQEFVVELVVKPWDRNDLELPAVGQESATGQGTGHIRFQPYYSDEEGKVYFRRQASVVQYSVHSIAHITKQDVKEQYLLQIKRLQQEIQQLEQEKARRQQIPKAS